MTSTISPRNDVSVRNERRNSNQFSANQKHYQDLGSDASSLCAHFSWADVITRGNQWWPREMSAVFLSIYLLGKITVGKKVTFVYFTENLLVVSKAACYNSLYETLSKHGLGTFGSFNRSKLEREKNTFQSFAETFPGMFCTIWIFNKKFCFQTVG